MNRTAKAFTLVEILVVVVILGIIAAIVVPRFSNASAIARASMMADDLRVMRMQVQVYRSQHVGVSAGYVGGNPASVPTEEAFVAAMTLASKATGETAAPRTAGYNYGPYLREMPPNPVNGKSTVQMIANDAAFPATADNSHGWIYQPQTQVVRADCTGSDDTGKAYFDY